MSNVGGVTSSSTRYNESSGVLMLRAGDPFEPTVWFAVSLTSTGWARDVRGASQILGTPAGALALLPRDLHSGSERRKEAAGRLPALVYLSLPLCDLVSCPERG